MSEKRVAMESMSPGGGGGGGGEMQCVGRLEISRPKAVGLLCIGSLPVPTDQSFRDFNSALVPSSQTVTAPRYRILPTETDLNMPPMFPTLPDRVLPIHYGAVVQSRETHGDVPWDSSAISSNLARRGEALAVMGLVEYGDDIDVIAPADVLKQIFKMPYSKARLSIAVHRIGHTLVLNAGPGIDEGERLVRRNQPKCADHALFLNFAMHSVRMEACDCPPTHSATDGQTKSPVLPDYPESHKSSFTSSEAQGKKDVAEQSIDDSELEQETFYRRSMKNKSKGHGTVERASQVGGKTRCSMQESEKYRRRESDEFLRVLFWQFHNFRMLLGSDLLLFSNEKYLAVSLHLWDVSQQVTPLTWLDAWLDNVMASVPELAICYHQNGVVQGYELLKTDDIFLMKGISEDGTPAFHPHVVQQNGLSVLRFLQANCEQDPGAYWLYKSAGEDVIQLFDLSIVPKDCQSDCYTKCTGSLPSFISRGRIDALSSLGTLLYRVAHRLSLSNVPSSRARGTGFLRKCLEISDESDHLVTRAMAHEQYARLILNNDEGLELIVGASPIGSEVIVSDSKDESLDLICGVSDSNTLALPSFVNENQSEDFKNKKDLENGSFKKSNLSMGLHKSRTLMSDSATNKFSSGVAPLSQGDETSALCSIPPTSEPLIQTIADPVSSKHAAVHHVSQAIKSLRWMHQLQQTDPEISDDDGNVSNTFLNPAMSFSLCACGDTDCIEVCDIKQWLPTLKLDHKLWKLILLLGESYLALGEAYREDGQLLQALKVVEIACSIYGSMPQYLENTKFISSMVSRPVYRTRLDDRHKKRQLMVDDKILVHEDFCDDEPLSTYLFWSKAWTLVGDVYVEFYKRQDMNVTQLNQKSNVLELRMPSEVVEELMRLKKKLSKDTKSCNTCSLVNCSCQSDRASSGYSASSSSVDNRWFTPCRRKGKRSHGKTTTLLQSRQIDHVPYGLDVGKGTESRLVMPDEDCETLAEEPDTIVHHPMGSSSSLDSMSSEKANDGGSQTGGVSLALDVVSEATSEEAQKLPGGIFKCLHGPITADADNILAVSLNCYEQARKASDEIHMYLKDVEEVTKKIGWVCNELGRNLLEKKKLDEAERVFVDGINAFKEVSDSTNVVLINCNLGHGRRALAEELVSKMEYLKNEAIFHNAYKHTLETTKMNYARSLRFYQAAMSEIAAVGDGGVDVSIDLRNEVYTQLAHTYLRLGMLLAKEDTVAEVYDTGTSENRKTGFHGSRDKRMTKKSRKHEMSANDAIIKALSMYESLGALRNQEAAYACFQLACHQRDRCLRIIDLDNNRSNDLMRNESSSIHRSKVLAERCWQKATKCKLLAERYWEKAIKFYKADTHPDMYLTILVDRSTLSFHLSICLHSNTMLESALTCLLDGHYVSSYSESVRYNSPEIYAKFWSQLQKVLLKMVQYSSGLSKTGSSTLQSNCCSSSAKRLGAADKVKELYRMSLKSTEFAQLHDMHNLWTSSSQH